MEEFINESLDAYWIDHPASALAIGLANIKERKLPLYTEWVNKFASLQSKSRGTLKDPKDFPILQLNSVSIIGKASLSFFPSREEWEKYGGWEIIDNALRLMKGYYGQTH